jgi:hypothetical protein
MTDEQQQQEEAMTDIKELSAAMAKAFAQIEGAIRGKVNPAFRSKYADLAAVTDAIKPALSDNGLWYRQVFHAAEGGVCVETIIHHASGQSIACGPLFLPASKQDAQGFGSATTYARRYSLMAAFGVPAEDNDGQAAVQRPPAARAPISKEPDEVEMESVLSRLREAAMEGTDALQAAFKAMPGSDAKAAVWATHGASLKAAAAKAGVTA